MSQAATVTGSTLARGGSTRRGPRPATIVRLVALIFFSVVFVTPLFWLVSTAFKSEAELGASPIHWLPLDPRVANFTDAWTLIDYWKFTWHSLFLAGMNATLVTASSALVGFGFGRLKGKGKTAL